MTVWTTK